MVSSSFHLETSYGNDMDWTNEAVLNSFSVTDEPLLMLKKSNLRESTLGWHYLNHFDIKSLLIEMACELSHHIRHTPWLKKQHKIIGEDQLLFLLNRLTGTQPGTIISKEMIDQTDYLFYHLSEYEDLYYALVAKVRQLHQDLSLRFREGWTTANQVLHTASFSEGQKSVTTAGGLEERLRGFYELVLTDKTIMKTLNLNVSKRQMLLAEFKSFFPGYDRLHPDESTEKKIRKLVDVIPDNTIGEHTYPGLMKATEMSPAMITATVWEKYHGVHPIRADSACSGMSTPTIQQDLESSITRHFLSIASPTAIPPFPPSDVAAATAAAAAWEALAVRTDWESHCRSRVLEDLYIIGTAEMEEEEMYRRNPTAWEIKKHQEHALSCLEGRVEEFVALLERELVYEEEEAAAFLDAPEEYYRPFKKVCRGVPRDIGYAFVPPVML